MLEGLVVAERSGSVAARFCGWLFASNGATVVASGPPSGDAALDAFLDSGKVRDRSTDDADVVIADPDGPWADRPAGAVTGAVDARGVPTGPGAEVSEAVLAAVAGAAAFTLDVEGRPIVVGGYRYQYLAGAYLYCGLVSTLAAEERPATTPQVTVDLVEAVIAALPYPTTQYEYNGSSDTQQQSGPRFVLPARDGWVAVYAGARWDGIAALLGDRLDEHDRARFESVDERFRDLAHYNAVFAGWAAGLTVEEAVAEGVRHSVAVAAVRPLDAVLDDPDLVAEGAWTTRPGPDGRELRVPTLACRVGGRPPDEPGPPLRRSPAPLPRRRPLAPERAAATAGLPLAGLRVVDLTHIWSGPLATRVLAGLGAEVVRVENPTRPDSLRGKVGDIRSRYPADGLGDDYLNRNAWFNTHNTDKLSVTADLKVDADRERFLALVAESDVVVANYRPGVLDRLGVGLEQLRAVNPDIVLVEMPGHFSTSRHARAAVYGAQMEASSGAPFVLGGPGHPVLTGYAFGDPAGGLTAAAAVVTALARRAFGGGPTAVEVSQSQSMLAMIGEELARAQVDHEPRQPTARRLSTADGRWAFVEPPPGAGADWEAPVAVASSDDVDAACAELSRLGVAAAPVRTGAELLDDDRLADGRFFRPLDHPSCGRHRYPGLPLRIGDLGTGARWPAPLLGEHQTLLEEWLLRPSTRKDDGGPH